MMNSGLFLKICAFALFAMSGICHAEFIVHNAQSIKNIKIEGLNLEIMLEGSPKYKDINLEAPKDIKVKIKDGTMNLIDSGYQSRGQWSRSQKKLKITIKSKSLPIQIHSHQSDVTFKNWKANSFLTATRATVNDYNREGDFKIFMREGQFESQQHKKGSLYLNGFVVKAKMENFSDVKTDFHFSDGELRIKKGDGQLTFTTGRAPIRIRSFYGNVDGKTQSSDVIGSFKIKDNVSVQSQEGNLRVSLLGRVGARVHAYSEKGKVYVPRQMYKEYSGKSTKAVGRAKGTRKNSKISLITNTGNIQLYE